MTKTCPVGLDCLIYASECGYPGWTESPCITWQECHDCCEKEDSERLKEEIKHLQSVPFPKVLHQ